jgi:hypothetical protein
MPDELRFRARARSNIDVVKDAPLTPEYRDAERINTRFSNT